MATAFQRNAFQHGPNKAFQIDEDGPPPPPAPGNSFGLGMPFYSRKKLKQLMAQARLEIEDEEAGDLAHILLMLDD
jgi:hypothetical protein